MSFFDWLRRVRDQVILEPFSLHEFSALLQVKEPSGLEEELARIEAQEAALSPGVIGLHDLRLVLFTPAESGVEGEPLPAGTPRALLFSLIFDGRADEVLADLFEALPDLKWILCRCHGFDRGNESHRHFIRRLKHHRLRDGYLFEDHRSALPEGSSTHELDASRTELEAAVGALRRLEDFYAEHPPELAPSSVRAAFLREFAGAQFPLPLTPVERSVTEESRWALRAAEEMGRRQASAARRSDRVHRRAAHAKTIGVLRATFRVEPLPPEYRQGIFSEPREFPALVRLSNGSEDIKPDGDRDARGLAVGVELPASLGSDEELVPVLPDFTGRQDFVLFSHPTFFASSVRRFVMLLGILRAQDWKQALRSGFFFLLSRAAPRELVAAIGALSLRVRHSLVAEYHSGTAYRFGKDFVAKYSLMALSPARLAGPRAEGEPNFLASALRQSLGEQALELGFYVRLLPVADPRFASRSVVDLVEDPTFDWDAFGAEKVHVATLSIQRDALDSVDQSEGERRSFNVWNALVAHRPLGSLNRARLLAYPLSARRRHALFFSGSARGDNRQRGVVPDAAE